MTPQQYLVRTTFDLLSTIVLNGVANSIIACEPVLFRRDLSIKIRSDAQYPNNLTTFFESMNDTLLDLDTFRRFLLPATLSEEARRSTR